MSKCRICERDKPTVKCKENQICNRCDLALGYLRGDIERLVQGQFTESMLANTSPSFLSRRIIKVSVECAVDEIASNGLNKYLIRANKEKGCADCGHVEMLQEEIPRKNVIIKEMEVKLS